jgi:hypothetical protein
MAAARLRISARHCWLRKYQGRLIRVIGAGLFDATNIALGGNGPAMSRVRQKRRIVANTNPQAAQTHRQFQNPASHPELRLFIVPCPFEFPVQMDDFANSLAHLINFSKEVR